MRPTPTISIVIPTYRRPSLLRRSLASVFEFGDRVFEIVVVGDHDETPEETLRDFKDDARLKIHHNRGAQGAAATRNVGCALATGDRILFLDDDDVLLPNYLDLVAKARTAVWGFGAHRVRSNTDTEAHLVPQKGIRGAEIAGRFMPFRRKIAGLGCGFWIERELFFSVGRLSEILVVDEDTDLCCRLIAQGHLPLIASIPAVLVDRIETTERLTTTTEGETAARCYLETLKRNYGALSSHPGAREFLALRAQRRILRDGNAQLLDDLYASIPDSRTRALLHLNWLAKRLVGRAPSSA